ncbi:MAG TPA: hypothetical protein VN451_11685, partial [Chitinophagaceae bacterium]|nr:hypothetical protein [Chitinophagaceae bacterium]
RKTEYSKDKLNEEVNKAKDKEAVRRIIRLKNFPSAQLIIQVQHKNKIFSWWTINTTTGYEREDDDIILQSKTSWNEKKDQTAVRQPGDSLVWKVKSLADFKDVFRDSLVLLDTLYIEPHLQNEEYPNDGYKIAYVCKNGRIVNEKIPSYKGKLVLTSSLFNSCDEAASFVALSNKKNKADVLVSAYLRFLSAEEKEAILAMADLFKKTNPGSDIETVARFVAAYSSLESGKPHYPQLVSWLRKNLN